MKAKTTENKSILITGAYGGMGYETVKLFARNGFTVFALDKNVGEKEENIIPVKADVTNSEDIKNAFLTVSEVTDSLFAIIHFAGIYMLDSLVEMDESQFRRIFDINTFGAFLINKTFLPLLKKRIPYRNNDKRACTSRSPSLHGYLRCDKSRT